GLGAFPVYRTPRGRFPFDEETFPDSFQTTFLADGQDNFAWAIFGEIAYDITERTELAVALRYDEDTRKQTTLTPEPFLALTGLEAETGEVRKNTWDELQPRLTLSHRPTENLTLYGGWSRGFRSGGFNQTGVEQAALQAGFLGVGDLFTEQVADTLEFGLKSRLANGRVNLNFSVFDTVSDGGYFFVFLAESSTQNLGSLGEIEYQGFEFDITARVSDYLELYAGYGATDSEITESVDPAHIGKEAPLVNENTIHAGVQYSRALGSTGLELFLRGDYQRIGDTYWEPVNYAVRNPVNLLDWRFGIRGDSWSLIGWQRNFNNVKYNT